MATTRIAGTDCHRRASRWAIRSTPIGDSLARDEFVAGLRCVFQRAGLGLESTFSGGKTESCALSIASALADVAAQFGLAHGELVEIVGERMAAALQEAEHH